MAENVEIFDHAFQAKEKLIADVDSKLMNTTSASSSTKDIIAFISHSLHKISILTSYQVFLQENGRPIMKDAELDDYIYLIDDLLKYQIQKSVHKHNILSRTEMIENFVPYEKTPTQLLYKLIVKQHYLILMITNYFKIDMRRDALRKELIFKLAKVSRNYCNIKAYMNRNSQKRDDINLIENIITKNFNLQQLAIKEVFSIWSTDKTMFWGSKCLQFWANSLEAYKLFNSKEDIEKFKAKLLSIEKRILTETKTQKNAQGKVTKEELLSYEDDDSNFDIG